VHGPDRRRLEQHVAGAVDVEGDGRPGVARHEGADARLGCGEAQVDGRLAGAGLEHREVGAAEEHVVGAVDAAVGAPVVGGRAAAREVVDEGVAGEDVDVRADQRDAAREGVGAAVAGQVDAVEAELLADVGTRDEPFEALERVAVEGAGFDLDGGGGKRGEGPRNREEPCSQERTPGLHPVIFRGSQSPS